MIVCPNCGMSTWRDGEGCVLLGCANYSAERVKRDVLEELNVAIIVPRRPDGGHRDRLWKFTLEWLMFHHPRWAIVTGDSPEGPFNRGAALNDAARTAMDQGAQVLVVHDGDNITDPERLVEAVYQAHGTGHAWFPSDCYMYLDEQSSQELRDNVNENCLSRGCSECSHFWPRPAWFKENLTPARVVSEPGYNASVRNKHISGILAVPVEAWKASGGFVELSGWGREDAIFWLLLEATSGQPKYIAGTSLHFFHGHKEEDTTQEIKRANTSALNDFKIALKSPNRQRALQKVAAKYSHTIPLKDKS